MPEVFYYALNSPYEPSSFAEGLGEKKKYDPLR